VIRLDLWIHSCWGSCSRHHLLTPPTPGDRPPSSFWYISSQMCTTLQHYKLTGIAVFPFVSSYQVLSFNFSSVVKIPDSSGITWVGRLDHGLHAWRKLEVGTWRNFFSRRQNSSLRHCQLGRITIRQRFWGTLQLGLETFYLGLNSGDSGSLQCVSAASEVMFYQAFVCLSASFRMFIC